MKEVPTCPGPALLGEVVNWAEAGTPREWRGGSEVAAVRVLAHQASEKNSNRTLGI